jgi:NADPH-dependent 2,4-dienoyl-CoA reductase/sulfur reductase-like enzyme
VLDYRYLIVGGGMTGHAAATAIHEADPGAAIGMIGEERHPPYARPPLSKGLWRGAGRESVFLAPPPGLVHHAGRRAVRLDVGGRQVVDDQGDRYRYQRLLLATGGRPRSLPGAGPRVMAFRTLDDYDRLRALQGGTVVVVGGGFIGSELAASLRADGADVTMIFPETGIGARAFPAELTQHVTRRYEEHGVRLLRGQAVTSIEGFGDRLVVRTSGRAEILADAVVTGLGIVPETSLAEEAGLQVRDGILVDDRLLTSGPHVWAAGDVARAPSSALGGTERVEHEDAAVEMGRVAGRSMAGLDARWTHLPFFYSDLFEMGYEAVGRLDARMETVASWRRPLEEGVVYYLEHGRVRGVLLWGLFGQVDAARALIERRVAPPRDELVAAIH